MPSGQGRWKKPLPDAWWRGGQRRAQGRAEWELATRAIHIEAIAEPVATRDLLRSARDTLTALARS